MRKGKVMIKDAGSKFGTLLYDSEMELALQAKYRAVQMENVVFSFKIIQKN
jgi:hypothetical protein